MDLDFKLENNLENNNEIKNFTKDLIDEQKNILNQMRKEGATYKITYLEDDCEIWRTELTNIETGETFQELEFPHEIYHHVGVNSLVKYENGKYNIVEGTSVYDLYPNLVENYCEIEGVYVTKDNKYKTVEELYASLNKNPSNENSNNKSDGKFKNKIESFLDFLKEKFKKIC